MERAWLRGRGWGKWRGWWGSRRILVARDGSWSLVTGDGCAWSEPGFVPAVERLWRDRSARGDAPFLLGWLGYEDALWVAGLPAGRGPGEMSPSSVWLVEPEPLPAPCAPPEPGGAAPGSAWRATPGDGEYRRGVAEILGAIAAGAVYQANLTRRFTVEGWRGGLGTLLERAAAGGEPPYLSWFSAGGVELVSASMELLLRRRGRLLETRPIKGTRPRGSTREADRALARDLDADPKERAELAMVVDLERNDLGRVAVPGSVCVADPGTVRRYATVLHRVARVTARLRGGLSWWDVMAAVVPGGSVTGCPKAAAVEILSRLEPLPRGPYTGALGVVSSDGSLELALPIRTAWRVADRVSCAAGCGIVWGSDPGREEAESRLKVARWLEAPWKS